MRAICLSLLILTAVPVPSFACFNGVVLRPKRIRPPIAELDRPDAFAFEAEAQLIASAEAALEAGHPLAALRILDGAPSINLRTHKTYLDIGQPEALANLRPDPRINTESPWLRRRFERVVAVSIMRAAPSQSIISLQLLSAQLRKHPGMPQIKARVAEAMFVLGQKPRARTLLEELDSNDLMPDRASRKLLSKLRRANVAQLARVEPPGAKHPGPAHA